MKPWIAAALLAAALPLALPAWADQAAAPATAPATTVASDSNYLQRVPYQTYFADYLALRKGRQADIVFIGDSITEQWRWGAGNAVWRERFEHRAFDFGLGADRTQHVLWRLRQFDLSFLKPKAAVIMIGTNNVADQPEDIASGVQAVIAATRQKFPGVRVVLMSILPNERANAKMAAVNRLLAPLADGKQVHYLDLASRFTPEGDNWKGLSRDKLHLTEQGYTMWADALDTLLPTVLAN
jgi:lysophospholipase L1-like esterase